MNFHDRLRSKTKKRLQRSSFLVHLQTYILQIYLKSTMTGFSLRIY